LVNRPIGLAGPFRPALSARTAWVYSRGKVRYAYGRRLAMMKTIEATFDGSVFKPTEPVLLEPNTRVQITFKTEPVGEPQSFLDVALSLNLDGPPDWSKNLEEYLYGQPDDDLVANANELWLELDRHEQSGQL
jgi:predicted DNA-binding antitoxin AbrB/MazE fold protein